MACQNFGHKLSTHLCLIFKHFPDIQKFWSEKRNLTLFLSKFARHLSLSFTEFFQFSGWFSTTSTFPSCLFAYGCAHRFEFDEIENIVTVFHRCFTHCKKIFPSRCWWSLNFLVSLFSTEDSSSAVFYTVTRQGTRPPFSGVSERILNKLTACD